MSPIHLLEGSVGKHLVGVGVWRPKGITRTNETTYVGTGAAGTHTISHTVSDAINRLLVVIVSGKFTASNLPAFTVAWGGVTVPEAVTIVPTSSYYMRSSIHVLAAPAVGTANLTVSATTSFYGAVTILSLAGVDQATPTVNVQSVYGTGTSKTVTLTGMTSYDLALDALTIQENLTNTLTPGAGQVAFVNQAIVTGSGGAIAGHSRIDGIDGNQAVSWSMATSRYGCYVAAGIKAA